MKYNLIQYRNNDIYLEVATIDQRNLHCIESTLSKRIATESSGHQVWKPAPQFFLPSHLHRLVSDLHRPHQLLDLECDNSYNRIGLQVNKPLIALRGIVGLKGV